VQKKKKSAVGDRQALLTIQCVLCAYRSLVKSHISLVFHWEDQDAHECPSNVTQLLEICSHYGLLGYSETWYFDEKFVSRKFG